MIAPKSIVLDRVVDRIVCGVPVALHRRRHNNTAFTWVRAFIGGEWKAIQEPWDGLHPPELELVREVQRLINEHGDCETRPQP